MSKAPALSEVEAISPARAFIRTSNTEGSEARSMAWQKISTPEWRTMWCAGSAFPLA